MRMPHLAKRLTEEGYPVSLFGCGTDCLPDPDADTEMRICQSLSKATEGADILILPLPASRDGETIHTPRDPACRVTLSEISDLMSRTPGLTLFGGKLPRGFLDSTREFDPTSIRVTDYYDSEILQLRNAYITAEAAALAGEADTVLLFLQTEAGKRTLPAAQKALLDRVTRLRKKIGEYGKRIVTRLGYGYCFECE